jgi:hypothetical protein
MPTNLNVAWTVYGVQYHGVHVGTYIKDGPYDLFAKGDLLVVSHSHPIGFPPKLYTMSPAWVKFV